MILLPGPRPCPVVSSADQLHMSSAVVTTLPRRPPLDSATTCRAALLPLMLAHSPDIDAALTWLVAVRRSIRDQGGDPSTRQIDELL